MKKRTMMLGAGAIMWLTAVFWCSQNPKPIDDSAQRQLVKPDDNSWWRIQWLEWLSVRLKDHQPTIETDWLAIYAVYEWARIKFPVVLWWIALINPVLRKSITIDVKLPETPEGLQQYTSLMIADLASVPYWSTGINMNLQTQWDAERSCLDQCHSETKFKPDTNIIASAIQEIVRKLLVVRIWNQIARELENDWGFCPTPDEWKNWGIGI